MSKYKKPEDVREAMQLAIYALKVARDETGDLEMKLYYQSVLDDIGEAPTTFVTATEGKLTIGYESSNVYRKS